MNIRIGRKLAAAASLMLLASGAALAQDYPNRPIRFLVGFAAGGSSERSA